MLITLLDRTTRNTPLPTWLNTHPQPSACLRLGCPHMRSFTTIRSTSHTKPLKSCSAQRHHSNSGTTATSMLPTDLPSSATPPRTLFPKNHGVHRRTTSRMAHLLRPRQLPPAFRSPRTLNTSSPGSLTQGRSLRLSVTLVPNVIRNNTEDSTSTSLPTQSLEESDDIMSPKDAAEIKLEEERTKVARSHPLYQQTPDKDGKYHCPEEGNAGCSHKPTSLKCNYE
jgi:hypothetical protein